VEKPRRQVFFVFAGKEKRRLIRRAASQRSLRPRLRFGGKKLGRGGDALLIDPFGERRVIDINSQ